MDDQALTANTDKKRGSRVLVTALLFVSGLLVGRYFFPVTGASATAPFVKEQNSQRLLVFPTFWEAWDTLHDKYIGNLDDKKLFYGAVQGMIQAAGDPYTSFADPQAAKQLQETLEGSFPGVGIEIGLKNGLITVIAPLDGSPAKEAGIQEGDIIVAVDKQPIAQDTTLEQVVSRIRGPLGQTVTLTVISKGENATKDIAIVRNTITVETVKPKVENNMAIIKITSFNSDTADHFGKTVQTLSRQNIKGVVLDMRGNPGGYLTSAVDVASHFLQPGQVVVSEKGKESDEYKSRGRGEWKAIPVVVLVDGGSASAAEIVAGALKDQRGAPIIGEKTFGKGSVQELVQLSDDSSLKVTIAKWFTPKGASINESGIEPTIKVEDNKDTDTDEQLDRAKQELQSLINPS